MPPTGGGGGGNREGQFAPGPQCKEARAVCPRPPSVRGPPNSSNKIRLSVTFQSSFFKGLVSMYFRLKSACCFALRFMLLTQIMRNYLTWLLRSPLARAPYVVLFDPKPLIEDGSFVHARTRASGTPRTHFRPCAISKFPGGVPPDPPSHHPFCDAPIMPWAPPNLLGGPVITACPQTPLTSSIL